MSTNPILRQFASQRPVAVVQDAQGRQRQMPYGQATAWRQPGFEPSGPAATPGVGRGIERMTFDDVLTKSMLTIGLMVVVAGATFLLVPTLAMAAAASAVGSIVALVTSFIVAARRHVGPVGALLFAAVEGVTVGGFSAMFEAMYPGIVAQAVLATFVAAGATLAAFRGFKIKVGNRFRRGLAITMGAYVLVMLVNVVLSLFGVNLGLFDSVGSISMLGVLVPLIGAGLAVASLITDFDDIQRGIQSGASAQESWRAAFGLTVTMVWLYTNILRLLSYLRRD